jgi:Protein of unknown function (DUF3828)
MHKIRLVSLFAAAAFFFSGASIQAQSRDPRSLVNSFYATYTGRHLNWLQLAPLRSYLTPSLYASLQKAATIQAQSHEEVLDFDPFANSQEEARSFTVGSASVNGVTATVPVNIGGGVRVVTVRGSAGWKIDNFVYPGVGNLRTMLAGALK